MGIDEKTNEIPEMHAVFKEDSLSSKEKKAIHNLGLIRRFVMFIIKLMKAYYGRSMRRVRKTIGRKPGTELPLIPAVLGVLYTNDLLDSIDKLQPALATNFIS